MIQDQHWDWQSLWKWLHYIWCQYKSRGLFRSYCDYNGYSMSSSILSGRLLARDSTSLCLPLGSVIVGPHVARGVQLTRLRSWNVEMCLLSTPLARYLHLSSSLFSLPRITFANEQCRMQSLRIGPYSPPLLLSVGALLWCSSWFNYAISLPCPWLCWTNLEKYVELKMTIKSFKVQSSTLP